MRVVDVNEFLAELGPAAPRHELPLKVAYQDACHLGHAQGIRDAPRLVLRSIPGLELVEPAEQPICCGSAGIYILTQPAAASELGERKAANVAATGGVDDDRVEAREQRAPIRSARRRPSAEPPACRCSAPQHSCARRDDLAAFGREHARGRRVHVAEDDALDAAEQKADARAPLPHRRRHRGGRADERHGGFSAANGASGPAAAAASARARAAAARVGHRRKTSARWSRSANGRLWCSSMWARVSRSAVVLDAGRARGHAGHAAEAAVEVLDVVADSGIVPSTSPPIRWMRPRGESISSCQSGP